MATSNPYAVIPAPGYAGEWVTVISTHRTLAAARRGARPTAHMRYVVIERPGARKGDRLPRAITAAREGR